MQTNSWRQSQCRKLALSFPPPYGCAPICSHFIAGINDGRAAAAFGARGFRLCFFSDAFFSFHFILCVLCWIKWKFNWFALASASALTMAKAKYAKGSTIVGDSFCHTHHRHMLSFKGNEQLYQQVWNRTNIILQYYLKWTNDCCSRLRPRLLCNYDWVCTALEMIPNCRYVLCALSSWTITIIKWRLNLHFT